MSEVDPKELDRAENLFRSFQGRAATKGEIITLGGLEKPVVALAVGTAVNFGYKALGDGKDYLHDWEGPKPKVFVSADGQQVFFVGGGYRFTYRGFVG